MKINEIRYTVYRIRINDFKILSADINFEEITGYTNDDIYDNDLKHTELIPKTDIVDYLSIFNSAFIKPDKLYYEHRLTKKNGDVIVVFSMVKSYINKTNGELEAEVTITDVTDTNMLSAQGLDEQQYVSMTEHDALTGLYNRGLFENKVDEMINHRNMGRCAMIIIYIDNIRAINDIFSHNAGDLALNAIATVLLTTYRSKTIIARTGGTQFSIFIPEISSRSELEKNINIIMDKLDHITVPEYPRVNVTSLFGATLQSRDGLNFHKMFHAAKNALSHTMVNKKKRYYIQSDVFENKVSDNENARIMLLITANKNKISQISEVFENRFIILSVSSTDKAIKAIDSFKEKIVIVLADIYSQGIDGFVVLDYMRRMDYIRKVPIIFWSKQYNEEIYKNAFSHGIIDIFCEPFDYYSLSSRINNTIELYQHKNHLEEMTRRQTMKIEKLNTSIIDSLGTVVEFRNLESGDHIKRVKKFTKVIAEQIMKDCPEYELTPWKIKRITDASPLHDVGKIAISDTILLKPGKLTKEEFEIMKTHTTRGGDIINIIFGDNDEEFKTYCLAIAKFHHEKFDGKGYPFGLKGDDIPVCAQIVSIADVYDALISERCYKKAFSKQEAYQMIMNGECGAFNPKMLSCFTKVRSRLEKEADQLKKD